MILTKRSQIAGDGAFATRAYQAGAVVMKLTGKRMRGSAVDRLIARGTLRQDDPFEIGDDMYLVLDHTPLMANHSCNPNTGVRGVNTLIALRGIKPGEEITYDYSTVVGRSEPHESNWVLRCRCNADSCRKRIGSWETIPSRRLAYYKRKRVIPAFVLAQIRED